MRGGVATKADGGKKEGKVLMDFDLSEEQKMIVDMCRRFVREEILPLEDKLDPDTDELEPEDS